METALALPLFLLLLFVTIDLCRAAYIWVMIGRDAEAAARFGSLPDNQASDCSAIRAVVTAGNGVTVSVDSNSIMGDSATGWTPPATLPSNSGALYIYPAQAIAAPPASNCVNTNPSANSPERLPDSTVTAQVNYAFQPWTPIASQLFSSITLSAGATEETQY